MKTEFYQKVLPSKGIYCAVGISQEGDVVEKFTESVQELMSEVEELDNNNYNVFVALNSFSRNSRKAVNAEYARSFFVDIDVGDGPRKYRSKRQAIEALDTFLKESQLPPPVRVDSGTGIHAYWVFDSDIPSAEWVVYAKKFKEACLQSLNIDPAVTADRARILRVPGTFNRKTDPSTLSKFLDTELSLYSFEEFKEYLGPGNLGVQEVLALAEKGLDDDTKKILAQSNFESVFDIIATKSMEGTGCAQIKYILENRDTLSEPLWHSGLSIARHCVDWESAIHDMSEGHPTYDRENTIRKAQETDGKPHSCDVFADRNPGGCDGCPHRGKITNPLVLGRRLKEVSAAPPNLVKPRFVLPESMKPFFQGAGGGIYIKDGDEDAILISQHDIYPIKRMFSPTEGECLLMRYELPHDPEREFPVPMSIIHAQEELTKRVASMGIFFNPISRAKYFMRYMIQWAEHMRNTKTAEQLRMQNGWTEDLSGFVVGHTEYRRDGQITKAASSPMVHSMAKLLKPSGDYKLWKQAADKLNIPGMEIFAFGLLCGLGSPLMRYTSTSGVSVCLTGGTGYGKTGSLYAGLSLFGDPKELSLVGGKDQATVNGMIGWYLGLKNIMLGLDEASNRESKELSNLAYQISQGKSKLRMQSSVNAVRDLELSASLICLMTSNHSIYGKLKQIKDNPDGEIARLLEFVIEKPKPMADNPNLGKEIFDPMRFNYGHAGPEYVETLFKLGEPAVKAVIDKWNARFNTDLGKMSEYRFYENLISACFAGGEIACRAGIISFDLDRMYRVMMRQIQVVTRTEQMNHTDYDSTLGEFQNRNQLGTLIIGESGHVIREPRSGLVARIEVKKQIYYASKKDLRFHLTNAGLSVRDFENYMIKSGGLVFDGKIRMASGWPGMSSSPVAVYGFKYSIAEELLDKT
jgi:hypothetical protein